MAAPTVASIGTDAFPTRRSLRAQQNRSASGFVAGPRVAEGAGVAATAPAVAGTAIAPSVPVSEIAPAVAAEPIAQSVPVSEKAPTVAAEPSASVAKDAAVAQVAPEAADVDVSVAEASPSIPLATRRDHERITRAIRSARPARRRLRSRKVLVSSAIVATGVLVGSGFVVQTTVSANQAAADKAASTARTQADVVARVEQSKIDAEAQNALSKANAVVDQAATKVDATPLITSIASLSNYTQLDTQTVTALTTQTVTQADTVAAAAAEADRVAAEAAAAAAAQAAADAAAAAEAAAEALAQGNTVAGAKATASSLASSKYGWGDSQFSCLSSLWSKESGWRYDAYNASSGATGIPQALPGSKMATIADDWATNATTQILWGLAYIKGSYGTPCAAWSHSQSVNWY